MDWKKWESSKNFRKSYGAIAQDIIECNISIQNPDYKEPEGGIKAHHRGTLPGMLIIHHPD